MLGSCLNAAKTCHRLFYWLSPLITNSMSFTSLPPEQRQQARRRDHNRSGVSRPSGKAFVDFFRQMGAVGASGIQPGG